MSFTQTFAFLGGGVMATAILRSLLDAGLVGPDLTHFAGRAWIGVEAHIRWFFFKFLLGAIAVYFVYGFWFSPLRNKAKAVS